MKRVFYWLLFTSLVFSGCSKAEDDPKGINNVVPKVTDYYPLAVGNYWIYQQYSCDSLEYDCHEYTVDSVYIPDSVLINGNNYYRMVRSHEPNNIEKFVRDSGDYIVDSYGNILFAINHFDSVLSKREEYQNDTVLLFTARYSIPGQTEYKVFADTIFECYNFKGEIFIRNDNFSEPRYCNHYFAKNVGLVYENEFYLSSERGIKRKIIRYNIK